jgi:hypothetical protein
MSILTSRWRSCAAVAAYDMDSLAGPSKPKAPACRTPITAHPLHDSSIKDSLQRVGEPKGDKMCFGKEKGEESECEVAVRPVTMN